MSARIAPSPTAEPVTFSSLGNDAVKKNQEEKIIALKNSPILKEVEGYLIAQAVDINSIKSEADKEALKIDNDFDLTQILLSHEKQARSCPFNAEEHYQKNYREKYYAALQVCLSYLTRSPNNALANFYANKFLTVLNEDLHSCCSSTCGIS